MHTTAAEDRSILGRAKRPLASGRKGAEGNVVSTLRGHRRRITFKGGPLKICMHCTLPISLPSWAGLGSEIYEISRTLRSGPESHLFTRLDLTQVQSVNSSR